MDRGAGSASIAASIAAKLKKKKALAELVAAPPAPAPTGIPGTGPPALPDDAEGVWNARVAESAGLASTRAGGNSSNRAPLIGT
jgi:hypothetical protein